MKKNKKIVILNGPNLNLLGKREPDIYGTESMDSRLASIRKKYSDCEIDYFQSNSEGGIIDFLHSAGFDSEVAGIVFNPGAYTHYSYAIADAVSAISVPVVEVHISNIFAREDFRSRSVTARGAKAVISGCGMDSYNLGVEFIINASHD